MVVQYRYETNGLISVSAKMPSVRRTALVQIRHAQTTDLDSLDAWRDRIRRGAVGAEPETGKSPRPQLKKDTLPSDRQQHLSRLDDLYVLVGKIAVEHPASGKSQKSHAMAAKAIQSAEAVQTKLSDVLTQQEDAQPPQIGFVYLRHWHRPRSNCKRRKTRPATP